MNDVKSNRRGFLVKSAAVVAGSVLGSAVLPSIARAQAHMGGIGHGEADGYVIPASIENHCGTCKFWGGPRLISSDKKTITATGLGWCNNPKSANYQKLTTPDNGPMDTWVKWGALG
jgi:anaerobic selenocysteine-containing dehydrogenase